MSKDLIPSLMSDEVVIVEGVVELFPGVGGWYFVRVPKTYTDKTKDLAERGFVAITVTLGKTTWKTSLLPYGDGTQFIALSAKVRKAERLDFGDRVSLSFRLRER